MGYDFPDSASVKKMISAAFRDLRRQGFRARSNFSCCSGCGCDELFGMTDVGQPWVFYHRQDNAALTERPSRGGRLGCYLTWGVKGCDIERGGLECPAPLREAAEAIVAAMRAAGLVAEWNGDAETRVWVQHPAAAVKADGEASVA